MRMLVTRWCMGGLLWCGGIVCAQEAQPKEPVEIAVLETVDKSGMVSMGVKTMIRDRMIMALANHDSYEVYDRSGIGSIIQEHEFQRTGLVSEDQIRRLGEMSGVSLILVTEVMPFSDSQISISAKVFDVETAKVGGTAMSVASLNPEEIENRCREMALKLFGGLDQIGKKIKL